MHARLTFWPEQMRAALRPEGSRLDLEPRLQTSAQWGRGERRHLTVMSCDLVNSVELSTRFDPEDLAEIIAGYQSCCESVVRQFDGYVARFTGDGLKAYFGYPRANEYDPERAVRAGLALVSAVKALRLRPGLVLSTRVGIATGEVVVGGIIGTGEAQERTVAGETPNLAARLQVLGEPDSVVIADTTKQLIGRLFEYDDLGRNHFKGFADPVQAWCVRSENPIRNQFEAVRTEAGFSPLVGRDEELAFLKNCWLEANAGRGQTVLLSGEAGVGKSRLATAFRRGLIGERSADLVCYCSPYHQNSSFYPISRHIEHAARFATTDSPEKKLEKLEHMLSEVGLEVSNVAPLLALLLSIPTQDRYPRHSFSPGQQRRLVLHTLDATIVKLTSKAPLLMLFEDVHWVDASTKEFLDRLIERAPRLPLFLLMTSRPDFTPSVAYNLKAMTRVLERLPRQQCEFIVEALDPHSWLPPATRQQILDYSDGLPLFLEELAKSALEAGRDQDQSRDRAQAASPSIRVPRTLQDSLLARLDRLGPWKRFAQTGAVIGRSFTFKLLAAIFPQEEEALKDALRGLVQAEFLIVRGKPPEATYTFAHALLQEAASACLLNADRRAIHGRIAQALDREFPDAVKSEPEMLALHYAGAGLAEPAIDYWRRAAEQALLRSANVEAAHHFGQALALLDTLPHSGERDQQELTLQTRLGAILTTIKGFAAPEVATAYERARALGHASKDPGQRFSVLRGLWVYDLVRAEWHAANELAEAMLLLGQQQHNAGYELEAHRALGMTLLWRGAFVQAHDHLQQGNLLYNSDRHHGHAFHYGNDPGVACLVHEAFVLWVLGYPDRALAASRKAISLARHLAHPFSLAQALIYATFVHQCRGEPRVIQNLAEEAKTLSIEHGFQFWLAEASILGGWALAAQGAPQDGIAQLRKGVAEFAATGARMDTPRWLSLLAQAYGMSHQVHEGLDVASEALTVVDDTKECFFQARLHQLQGELLLKAGAPDATVRAEACFHQALDVSRRQQAKSWELCAATSLARLWRSQGKRRDARELLAPVHGWFTEGFDTADVKAAGALLQELS